MFHMRDLNIVIGLQRTRDSLSFVVSVCPCQVKLHVNSPKILSRFGQNQTVNEYTILRKS